MLWLLWASFIPLLLLAILIKKVLVKLGFMCETEAESRLRSAQRHMHRYMHEIRPRTRTHTNTCIRTYAHTHVHAQMHTHGHPHVHMDTDAETGTYTCACTAAYSCGHAYLCMDYRKLDNDNTERYLNERKLMKQRHARELEALLSKPKTSPQKLGALRRAHANEEQKAKARRWKQEQEIEKTIRKQLASITVNSKPKCKAPPPAADRRPLITER